VSWQRLAIAALLHFSPAMLPIPGASRFASARDSASAADLQLNPERLARLMA
jgi:aryl-alcohol dehydrogenase-like predicted oxidoreductase